MKWIGQHIWDFISSFRSDVYIEAIESGTIETGGHLGLDSNKKLVKTSIASGPDEDAGDGETHSLKVKKVRVKKKGTWVGRTLKKAGKSCVKGMCDAMEPLKKKHKRVSRKRMIKTPTFGGSRRKRPGW